jgi:hypothetical protein
MRVAVAAAVAKKAPVVVLEVLGAPWLDLMLHPARDLAVAVAVVLVAVMSLKMDLE